MFDIQRVQFSNFLSIAETVDMVIFCLEWSPKFEHKCQHIGKVNEHSFSGGIYKIKKFKHKQVQNEHSKES